MKKKHPCIICNKETLDSQGIHLDGGYNFCDTPHLVEYVESIHKQIYKILENQEQRIIKLEKVKE